MGDAPLSQFANMNQTFDGVFVETGKGAKVDQFCNEAVDDLPHFIAVRHGFPRFRQQATQAEANPFALSIDVEDHDIYLLPD